MTWFAPVRQLGRDQQQPAVLAARLRVAKDAGALVVPAEYYDRAVELSEWRPLAEPGQ
jgi:hypothetical protein